jgi:uncharacterized protein YndB with AHSA1/START domain
MTSRDQVTVQRLIPAPPNVIFDLLADPSRHTELDGSGHLKGAGKASRRLKLGDTFGMSMKRGLFPYKTRNVVVDFEENQRIAWQTLGPPALTKFVTGRVWRYALEEVDGGTLVSETWDISQEAALARPAVRRMLTAETRAGMARTLATIEEIVAA